MRISRLHRFPCLVGASAALLFAGPADASETRIDDQLALAAPPSVARVSGQTAVPAGPEASAEVLERRIMGGAFEQALPGDTAPGVVRAARAAYARDLFRPIWSKEGADEFRTLSADLFQFGIARDRVLAEDLQGLVERRFSARDAAEAAEADLQLSIAWLRVASAVSGGLADNGAAADPASPVPGTSVLTAALLRAAAGGPEAALEPLEPTHPQYRGLKSVLRHYREIRQQGAWQAIPAGATIHPGESDPRVPALRQRLLAEGYVETPLRSGPITVEYARMPGEVMTAVAGSLSTPRVVLDGDLAEGLRRFQAHHGLEPDAVVGPNTLEALNEGVDAKIARIVDTMNRWRTFHPGTRFVWANIPSFTAEGWNVGRREIAMRTIVGQATRPTPVFSDQIEYAVPNPRWYVPVSIAERDKAPKLAKDPSYAARKGFAIFERSTGLEVSAWSVDWTDASAARRYKLVQAPGDGNALGELKILFPNQHSVYMHGTPDKRLFQRAQRAFSSGCVRLEDPVAMARWLASHDKRVDFAAIDAALRSGERKHFRFGETTPVHITYFTVTVADDGSAQFWRDVYHQGTTVDYAERYADLPTSDGSKDHWVTTASR